MSLKPLDDITLQGTLTDYARLAIPAHVPPQDFGRQQVQNGYVVGFGAALTIASRLEEEPPERRAAVLKRLIDEVHEYALKIEIQSEMPRA